MVHKPTHCFWYNPKILSAQRLLVFYIPIEGVLHEYEWCHFCTVKEIISGGIEYVHS